MKVKSLEINNFLGVGSAAVNFAMTSGLTLIEGENKDSMTASSNGAGKSSIFEGLLWGLYGITKRGLKGDDVINRYAKKKGCSVGIAFESGGVEYEVLRTRKTKEHGTTLKLYAGGEEITKGTVRETQELLESIIKISQVVFERAVYFGQEDMKSFASLTDKELKQVFEEALGLLVFSEGESKAKGYKKALDDEKMFIQRDIEGIDRDIEALQRDIENVETRKADCEKNAKAAVDGYNDDMEALQKEKENIKGAKKTEVVEADTAAIEKKVKELEALREKLSRGYEAKRDDFISKRSQVDIAVKELAARKKDKENANSLIGTNCRECGRPYDGEQIKEYVARVEQDIEARAKTILSEKADLEKKGAAKDKLKKLFGPVDTKVAELSREITGLKTKAALAKKEAETREKRLIQIDEDMTRKHENRAKAKADFDEAMDKLHREGLSHKATMTEKEKAKKAAEKKLRAIDEKNKVADMLVEILGNQGAKSYVFDSITPELNRAIARNMSVLDSDIEIELSTIKKLKSGEMREKFEIKVDNKNGAAEYRGNSGGEKGKVDIAISLALNDLMRTMASDVGVCFFDEPFENLDVDASEAVVDLLKDIDAENILITSHNQAIKDLIANKIRVVKKGGIARIAA